jgi:Porin PorA
LTAVRRLLGAVAFCLGILLIIGAALIKWVAAPALVKAPLDINSVTVSEGNAQVFVVASQSVMPVHVIATRTVRGDQGAGTSNVAVYDETLCLRTSTSGPADAQGCVISTDPGFIQKTTDRIAFNRKTGLAVPDGQYHASVNGDPTIIHDGLGYTFPIGTKQRSYPFFDTVLGRAFPMTFEASEKVNGLTSYRFVQTIPDSAIKINGVLPGTYSNVRTVWVEPKTGVIVKGSEQIAQKFSDGGIAFTGTLVFNDATVRSQVAYAKDKAGQIDLIRMWVPLGSVLLGVILLIVGVLLMLGRRSARPAAPVDGQVVSSQM